MFSFLDYKLWLKVIGGFILVNLIIALIGQLLLVARFTLKDLKKKIIEKEKQDKLKVKSKTSKTEKKEIKEDTYHNDNKYEQVNQKKDDKEKLLM